MKRYRDNPGNLGGNESLVLVDIWAIRTGGPAWTSRDKLLFLSKLITCYGPLRQDDIRVLKRKLNRDDVSFFRSIVERHKQGDAHALGNNHGITLENDDGRTLIGILELLVQQ